MKKKTIKKKKPVIKVVRKVLPKPKFRDLPEKERSMILKLVRRYISATGMAKELEMGLEHCEEIVINMLQDSQLKIVVSKDDKTYSIVPNEKGFSKNDRRK
jgi:hypothetical protein